MPPTDEELTRKLQKVVDDVGVYPIEAFRFLQQGLSYTVERIHGEQEKSKPRDPEVSRHISGQQLCEGLREYALERWGLMAGAVLRRWNITATFDFGRMVFALVDGELMQATDEDSVEDFRNVFDFRNAFDGQYRIEVKQ